MVFNLVTQVAAHDVEQPTARQVAGARQLAQIPVALGFIAAIFLAVNRYAFGEVTAKNNHVGPQIADQIGQEITSILNLRKIPPFDDIMESVIAPAFKPKSRK